MDTGATKHVSVDNKIFVNFEKANCWESLFMANFATYEVKGKDNALLKITSRKKLTLKNVLYV